MVLRQTTPTRLRDTGTFFFQEFNRGIFDYLIVTDSSMDVEGPEGPAPEESAVGDALTEENASLVSSESDNDTDSEEEDEGGEGGERKDGVEAMDEEGAGVEGRGDGGEGDKGEEEDDAGQSLRGAKKTKAAAAALAAAASGGVSKKRKGRGGRAEDSEFGAARGVDFQGVSFGKPGCLVFFRDGGAGRRQCVCGGGGGGCCFSCGRWRQC